MKEKKKHIPPKSKKGKAPPDPPEVEDEGVERDVRESQTRLIASLENELKLARDDNKKLTLSLETRQADYSQLKKEYDNLTRTIRQATKPMEEIEKMVVRKEEESSDEDPDSGDDRGSKKIKLPSVCKPKEGKHFGPFPEAQWRLMLVTGCHMQQSWGGQHPTNFITNHPPILFETRPEGYFLAPYILWDPVKIFGVSSPMCFGCGAHAMRPCGWALSGPRIAYTTQGVVLILGRLYRCGNGKTTGCNKTGFSTQGKLLRQWPDAVATAYGFLNKKDCQVELRLANQWLTLFTTSNMSFSKIAS